MIIIILAAISHDGIGNVDTTRFLLSVVLLHFASSGGGSGSVKTPMGEQK